MKKRTFGYIIVGRDGPCGFAPHSFHMFEPDIVTVFKTRRRAASVIKSMQEYVLKCDGIRDTYDMRPMRLVSADAR